MKIFFFNLCLPHLVIGKNIKPYIARKKRKLGTFRQYNCIYKSLLCQRRDKKYLVFLWWPEMRTMRPASVLRSSSFLISCLSVSSDEFFPRDLWRTSTWIIQWMWPFLHLLSPFCSFHLPVYSVFTFLCILSSPSCVFGLHLPVYPLFTFCSFHLPVYPLFTFLCIRSSPCCVSSLVPLVYLFLYVLCPVYPLFTFRCVLSSPNRCFSLYLTLYYLFAFLRNLFSRSCVSSLRLPVYFLFTFLCILSTPSCVSSFTFLYMLSSPSMYPLLCFLYILSSLSCVSSLILPLYSLHLPVYIVYLHFLCTPSSFMCTYSLFYILCMYSLFTFLCIRSKSLHSFSIIYLLFISVGKLSPQ